MVQPEARALGQGLRGETAYFKNSREPVAIKADVEKVLQFADLTPEKVAEILEKYGNDDGIEKEINPQFFRAVQKQKILHLDFPEKCAEG